MDSVAERIEDRAKLVVDVVGQGNDVEGGDLDIFGEGAGDVDPDAARLRVHVKAAAARGAAVHADHVALAGNALADAQIAHARAERDDLAGIFVADHHRHGHGALRPFVPVVDMNVGAADAGLSHLHQHFIRAGRRLRRVLQPEAGFGFRFDERFHDQTSPSSRPASVKAAIAKSTSASLSAADICVRMRARPLGTTG